MQLHSLIQEFVNSGDTLLTILEKHCRKTQPFEMAFLHIVKSVENKKYEKNVLEELDQEIINGHPDANLYLLFIINAIRFSFSFHQYEKAVSLYSILTSTLNEKIHPVIQAMCVQAQVQIKSIEGKINERDQLMYQSMSMIDKKSPRYSFLFNNYAKMLAANGMLYGLNKNELKILESHSRFDPVSFVEIKLMNYIMIGDHKSGLDLLEKYQSITQNKSSIIIDSSKALLEIIAGDLNEASFQKEKIKALARVIECLLSNNLEESAKLYVGFQNSPFEMVTTGHIEKYIPLHIELSKRNKGAARLLLKEIIEKYGMHFLDDLFYGRLQLLEKDLDGADQSFANLVENVNKFGAINRLNFELQFAKEMKLSDILLLIQGWKKNKIPLPFIKREMIVNTPAKIDKGIDMLVGQSQAILQVKDLVKKYATLKAPVLVTGETGTGKELVSRAIHDEGLHPTEPFLAINCGALSESLLQSELYGYVAGAFTGAQKERKGIFEAAGKGTVFLDEFGDITPQLQVSLLRVLETNEIRMIGGTVNRKIECRIVIATNIDLQNAVLEKKIREDLYYRLTKLEIRIPALRERKDDLVPLMEYFLNRENPVMDKPKKISKELIEALSAYRWPGNIRELKNELDRLRILHSEKEILNKEDFDFNRLQGYFQDNISNLPKPIIDNSLKLHSDIPKGPHEQSVTSENILRVIQRGSKSHRRHSFIKDLFRQYKKLTRSQIIEITDVSPATATKELQALCEEGFIVRHEPTNSPRTFYFEMAK